ncbi:GNAT family N-acetyltransferase [Geminocystis herdmanii]|uniref:GNAT family N-acetyltransferase n=1 Tax=Geminocystis herdmanii TaxID=669359 RepID=UPI0003453249|nr:GNAT family N-acetyltransferase [Geminocystis herdmanii]
MLHKNILIKSVSFESEGYDQAKKIRQQYLRNPLGLVFTPEDLEIDRSACHVIAYDESKVIGCVLGIQEDKKVKIRQMLVIPEYQKKGIGSLLLTKIEDIFSDLGIKHFYLHARQESLKFYLKNRYTPIGETFIEVGIPHQRADKYS